MKSILERVESVSTELARLSLKTIQLTSLKLAPSDPTTGSLRIKCILEDETKVEIFEYYSCGDLLKYSYVFIHKDNSILRYDNAPHHKVDTHPHHKHLGNQIENLEKPGLKEFIDEILEIASENGS